MTIRSEMKYQLPQATYASDPSNSRGRLIKETDSPTRSQFQRDRDRIVHCTGFRRMTYKTQVFIYHEGDHYRTRLTHSLEVAQIARSIARVLKLNEDLCEAIALAHDLGHTPFGHAGERALNKVTEAFGGFDHNTQSLRIVTKLEKKYAGFDGLNLTWETLDGLIKHNGPLITEVVGSIINDHDPDQGNITNSGVSRPILNYAAIHNIDLTSQTSGEGQTAAIADDIAYNSHDIDDGLRAGLIRIEDLKDIPLLRRQFEEINQLHGELEEMRLIYELNRRLITVLVEDAIAESRNRLAQLQPNSSEDIRTAGVPVIGFSNKMLGELNDLRNFLWSSVYRNPRIMRKLENAELIVRELFDYYMEHQEDLPSTWRNYGKGNREEQASRIRDFVAGMTDRYAVSEHRRLFDVTPDLR